MIAEHVWNYGFDRATNVIDVHMRNLRRKIDEPFPVKLIQTVRGAGYKIAGRTANPGKRYVWNRLFLGSRLCGAGWDS
jgi:DNA-binding winged helix-turn-helix (wHTH) protein